MNEVACHSHVRRTGSGAVSLFGCILRQRRRRGRMMLKVSRCRKFMMLIKVSRFQLVKAQDGWTDKQAGSDRASASSLLTPWIGWRDAAYRFAAVDFSFHRWFCPSIGEIVWLLRPSCMHLLMMLSQLNLTRIRVHQLKLCSLALCLPILSSWLSSAILCWNLVTVSSTSNKTRMMKFQQQPAKFDRGHGSILHSSTRKNAYQATNPFRYS